MSFSLGFSAVFEGNHYILLLFPSYFFFLIFFTSPLMNLQARSSLYLKSARNPPVWLMIFEAAEAAVGVLYG